MADPTAHQEPESARGIRADFGLHRKGSVGITQRKSLGTRGPLWGLTISQSRHLQGHKYAMHFDPATPLFGIPPKDIIAREKELYVRSCL